MKIKTISVDGLFGRHYHSINVFDGLTYVHSPNGCGKSTLIRALSLLFAGNIKELAKIQFERMDISFDNGNNAVVERSENGLSVLMHRNEIVKELPPEVLSSLVKATFITAERTHVKRSDGHMVPAAESYSNELSAVLKNAKKQTGLVIPPYKDDMDDDKFINWAMDLNAKLNFIRDAGFDLDISSSLKFPPTRYDLMASRKEYTDLVHGVSEFVQRNYNLSESVIVLKDIINNFFIDKDMKIDEKGQVTFLLDNGMTLPAKDLSSGEKQIFIIIYRLLFHTLPSSFVMIDEPETSLHVSWQQKIGPVLKDIARLRDLQIVAATHSPQIVHDDWELANELRAGRA